MISIIDDGERGKIKSVVLTFFASTVSKSLKLIYLNTFFSLLRKLLKIFCNAYRNIWLDLQLCKYTRLHSIAKRWDWNFVTRHTEYNFSPISMLRWLNSLVEDVVLRKVTFTLESKSLNWLAKSLSSVNKWKSFLALIDQKINSEMGLLEANLWRDYGAVILLVNTERRRRSFPCYSLCFLLNHEAFS